MHLTTRTVLVSGVGPPESVLNGLVQLIGVGGHHMVLAQRVTLEGLLHLGPQTRHDGLDLALGHRRAALHSLIQSLHKLLAQTLTQLGTLVVLDGVPGRDDGGDAAGVDGLYVGLQQARKRLAIEGQPLDGLLVRLGEHLLPNRRHLLTKLRSELGERDLVQVLQLVFLYQRLHQRHAVALTEKVNQTLTDLPCVFSFERGECLVSECHF
mmetsp:Transcript_34031/g.84136  ORF Transcript_34031/g.84136 Transcript_34031/m.84136 type:complete len:210 (-) Transcript_34031:1044-1673(-)